MVGIGGVARAKKQRDDEPQGQPFTTESEYPAVK